MISGIFDAYWDYLEGIVKGADKETVGILKLEVSNYLGALLKEIEQLQAKIALWEGE